MLAATSRSCRFFGFGSLSISSKTLCIFIVSLKGIEYGVYGDLFIIYPKPYSIYLRGTIGLLFRFRALALLGARKECKKYPLDLITSVVPGTLHPQHARP